MGPEPASVERPAGNKVAPLAARLSSRSSRSSIGFTHSAAASAELLEPLLGSQQPVAQGLVRSRPRGVDPFGALALATDDRRRGRGLAGVSPRPASSTGAPRAAHAVRAPGGRRRSQGWPEPVRGWAGKFWRSRGLARGAITRSAAAMLAEFAAQQPPQAIGESVPQAQLLSTGSCAAFQNSSRLSGPESQGPPSSSVAGPLIGRAWDQPRPPAAVLHSG